MQQRLLLITPIKAVVLSFYLYCNEKLWNQRIGEKLKGKEHGECPWKACVLSGRSFKRLSRNVHDITSVGEHISYHKDLKITYTKAGALWICTQRNKQWTLIQSIPHNEMQWSLPSNSSFPNMSNVNHVMHRIIIKSIRWWNHKIIKA